MLQRPLFSQTILVLISISAGKFPTHFQLQFDILQGVGEQRLRFLVIHNGPVSVDRVCVCMLCVKQAVN